MNLTQTGTPRNELVDINGPRALDLNGLYLLILNNHVLALGNLVAAHHALAIETAGEKAFEQRQITAVAGLQLGADPEGDRG